jgi:D-alanyl-D-alanine carboxypeptidase
MATLMRAYLMRELPLHRSWRRLLRSAARLLMAVATLGMMSACGSGDDILDPSQQYQTAVCHVMDSYRAPGVVAGVWAPGKTPWVQAFGVRDMATGTPLSPDDHFPIASVTKSFTVHLVLQLADLGLLSLDDTIDQYVAGIPNGSQISLLQLAAMESGIKNYTAVAAFLAQFTQDVTASYTEQALVDFAVAESPVFVPGSAYDYSNTNTVLLGMVVREVTGLAFADALQLYLLSPLQLRDTSYPVQLGLPVPFPLPHDADQSSGNVSLLPFIHPSSLAGAGAMVSTIRDLGTWCRVLGSGQLLRPSTRQLRLMHARAATNGPRYDNYGVGIGMLGGWLGHTGSSIGFQAACFYDPVSGATIAALANATPSSSAHPEDNIAEAVFIALAEVIAAGR